MLKPMKLVTAFAALLVLLSACSVGDVSGTYTNESHKSQLRLTKDKKIIAFDGAGEYSIEGSKIIIIIPMMGVAEGAVSGTKLVFPESNNEVGGALQRTWVKQ